MGGFVARHAFFSGTAYSGTQVEPADSVQDVCLRACPKRACPKHFQGPVPRAGLSQACSRACPKSGPVPSIFKVLSQERACPKGPVKTQGKCAVENHAIRQQHEPSQEAAE